MTKRNIRRDDSGTAVVGNLTQVVKPQFLSLVGKPANQRAFPVVRADDGESTMSKAANNVPRVRRTKRSDNPVLSIQFPADYTEEDVKATLETFGMADYTVTQAGGIYTAQRSDLQSISNETTKVKLNDDGVVALLDAKEFPVQRSDSKAGVKVVGFEFEKKTFDVEGVQAWISQNGVDNAQDPVENPDNVLISVKRSAVEDGIEVRRMELETGVYALVTRSDVTDVPANFVESVNEAAYGNWGWGQLDFNASFADYQFCKIMDDAIWKLRSVLDNIVFYSQLPLDARKQLIVKSMSQFGDFASGLIDALPQQVLSLVARSESLPKQENDMQVAGTSQNAQRSDASGQAAAPQAAAPAATETVTVSRAELAALIEEAVAKRSAPAATETPAAGTEATPAAAAAPAATETITRSDLTAAIAAAIAPLTEKVETLNSVTIVRNDANDPATGKAGAAGERQVFRGVLFNGKAKASK